MLLGDKGALKSMTVWGAALLAAVQALEASGALLPGTSPALLGVAQAVGTFLTIVGIRKSIAAPAA